jgi:hypothetical protein
MSGSGEVKAYFSDRRWDEALDLLLRRFAYGALAGGAAGLLLLSELGLLLQQCATRLAMANLGVPVHIPAGPERAHSMHPAGIILRRSSLCYANGLTAGGPSSRAAAAGLGAGFGLGTAYQKNQEVFHEVLGVRPTSNSNSRGSSSSSSSGSKTGA